MRIYLVLAASSAFALAACGEAGSAGGSSATTVEDPSDPAQIAAAADTLVKPQPGEYQVSVELVEFELPGVPEEEQEQARGFFEMMSGQTTTMCMTQEDTEEGFESFVEQMNQGAEGCEFSSFTVDGNQLDATMQCDDGAGASGTMEFAGTMSETSQDMTMTMDMENASDGTGMRMVIRNQTERIGDCEGDSAAG